MFHHNRHRQGISWQWNKCDITSSRNRTNSYGFPECGWSKQQFKEGVLLQPGKNCDAWSGEVLGSAELSPCFPLVSLIFATL